MLPRQQGRAQSQRCIPKGFSNSAKLLTTKIKPPWTWSANSNRQINRMNANDIEPHFSSTGWPFRTRFLSVHSISGALRITSTGDGYPPDAYKVPKVRRHSDGAVRRQHCYHLRCNCNKEDGRHSHCLCHSDSIFVSIACLSVLTGRLDCRQSHAGSSENLHYPVNKPFVFTH